MNHLDEKPDPRTDECSACGFKTNLKPYTLAPHHFPNRPSIEEDPEQLERWDWLCDICASTFAGNAMIYPEQYPDRHIMFMIAYVGNLLVAEIKGLGDTTEEEADHA